MSTGTWYNLIVYQTFDGKTHIFIGGTESSTGGQTITGSLTFDRIGQYWDGNWGFWFSGNISQVQIYPGLYGGFPNGAADIAALAAGTQPAINTWGRYALNENTGTVAKDSTPVPGGITYAQLSSALQSEAVSATTFQDWYDDQEPYGSHVNSRAPGAPSLTNNGDVTNTIGLGTN
jgi:hypothetical protein